MATEHPLDFDDNSPAVVFSALGGLTCSVCAPSAMTAREVEAFAARTIGAPAGGDWTAVDKSRLGLGRKTPEVCNVASGREIGRKHWFLIDASAINDNISRARCT